MKKELPVTEIENFLSESDVIISRTDPKGVITYASPDFARISEYTPEEMIGKPHNLIRHPDMPAAVFANLWDTIMAGMPWTGIVKNRAKSGNFYWVDATVTPIMVGEAITGYMSVRKKPDSEDVQDAEQLYRQIRSGQKFKKQKPRLKRGFFRIVLGILLLVFPFALISTLVIQHIDPVLLIGLASLQGIVFSLLVYGIFRVYKNLHYSLQAAIDLASGDLRGLRRIPTETEGETKLLLLTLKSLSISLWGIVTQIKKTVNEANKTAEILTVSSNRFTNSSGNLASSAEESAATMEELTGAIEQISQNMTTYSTTMSHMSTVITSLNENLINTLKSVENLGSLSRDAADKATTGEKMIRSLVDGMRDISESSEKIGEIVGIITDISEQTNLLALNASIEAARAGEAGRGFAVVAQEISKLSNQTAESVKQISDYIDSTAQAVEQGAAQVDSAVTEVRTILGMVNRINETASAVYASVAGQSEKMATVRQEIEELLPHGMEIDRAISDHRHASNDVTRALTEIAEQTQGVAEEAFHVSDISKQVKTHPAYLSGLIEHYRIEDES